MSQPPLKSGRQPERRSSRRPPPRQGLVYRLHVYGGLASAAIVLIIALTGIALNHTDALALGSRYSTVPLLLKWYGFPPPREARGLTLRDYRFAQLDELLYLNGSRLATAGPTAPGRLLGAAESGEWLALLTEGQLLLLTPTGELIESVPLPADLQAHPASSTALALGSDGQGNPCLAAQGSYWRFGLADGGWRPARHCTVETHRAAPLPATAIDRLLPDYYATSLSLERILLDLHSGRIFGKGGVLVFDGAAVLLLLQAITGALTWWRRR